MEEVTNIVQFQRKDTTQNPPEDPLLYVTIYPNSTIIADPNDEEIDKDRVATELFDSTFHVMADADDCLILVSIGRERTQSFRQPDVFDTPARRRWLRARLVDIYYDCTGETRPTGIFSRARAFLRTLFNFTPKQETEND